MKKEPALRTLNYDSVSSVCSAKASFAFLVCLILIPIKIAMPQSTTITAINNKYDKNEFANKIAFAINSTKPFCPTVSAIYHNIGLLIRQALSPFQLPVVRKSLAIISAVRIIVSSYPIMPKSFMAFLVVARPVMIL